MAWTFADIWESIAAAQPDHPAFIQGERTISWGQFDARADALAAHFIAKGMAHRAKVAAYLYNGPEYLESYFAAFKAGFEPVNTNYRYGPEELVYLFDNADAEAVIFHASFTDIVEAIRPRLPKVKTWVAVAEPGSSRPRLGRRLRRHRRRRAPPGRGALGPVRRRPAAALHRRHHRHAQGRDVAAGRPVPGAGRRRQRRPGPFPPGDLDAPS